MMINSPSAITPAQLAELSIGLAAKAAPKEEEEAKAAEEPKA